MEHHPGSVMDVVAETPRTLSEAENSSPSNGHRTAALRGSHTVFQTHSMPKCGGCSCHGEADYRIPKGSTPRTSSQELLLCVDCFAKFVERLRTSVLLPGEECEWELTLYHAENIYDGAHDYRRDLLRSKCAHRSCEAARKAKESDLAPPNEESA